MKEKMRVEEEETYFIDIYIGAGTRRIADQVCRKFCLDNNLCVNVTKVHFFYNGGEEGGIKVTLVNHPGFSTTHEILWGQAENLALELLNKLFQGTVLLQAPDRAKWFTRKLEDMKDT